MVDNKSKTSLIRHTGIQKNILLMKINNITLMLQFVHECIFSSSFMICFMVICFSVSVIREVFLLYMVVESLKIIFYWEPNRLNKCEESRIIWK